MKRSDIIKITAVTDSGKLIASITDNNFTKISECKEVILNKIPDSFGGKYVFVNIFNMSEETYKTYKILNGNYRMTLSAPAKKRKQTGTSNKALDKKRKALPVGKRTSKTGNVYTETRANRSDSDRRKRL